jgi:hypothetical protein
VAALAERGIWLPDAADRADLLTFVGRALRLDETAVIRLRARSDEVMVAWVATGFDVLAGRVLAGWLRPRDLSCAADILVGALGAGADESGFVDPGYGMDSAWRGGLPPDDGYIHLEDVPARVMLDLARQGTLLAREHGKTPVSLLDQEVVSIRSGDQDVGIPMRCVLALTAMGFLPQSPGGDELAPESVGDDEIVRVRVLPSWLRIDARYGSVYRRHNGTALIVVER